MRAVIVCNGQFPENQNIRDLIKGADIVICCDGALQSLISNMGFLSNIKACVGDFDSIFDDFKKNDWNIGKESCYDALNEKFKIFFEKLDSVEKERFEKLLHYDNEQNSNDMSKAFHFLLENFPEVKELFFLGTSGYREDHTLANLGLLMHYKQYLQENKKDISIQALSDYSKIIPLADTCTLEVEKGSSLSIISPDNNLKIISKGLQWQTKDVIFNNWYPATSNRCISEQVTLHFSHPSSALIILSPNIF